MGDSQGRWTAFYNIVSGFTDASCRAQCDHDAGCVAYNAASSGECVILVPGRTAAPAGWQFHQSSGATEITRGNGDSITVCMKKTASPSKVCSEGEEAIVGEAMPNDLIESGGQRMLSGNVQASCQQACRKESGCGYYDYTATGAYQGHNCFLMRQGPSSLGSNFGSWRICKLESSASVPMSVPDAIPAGFVVSRNRSVTTTAAALSTTTSLSMSASIRRTAPVLTLVAALLA